MAFLKRLGFYLFGLAIGIIFLAIFLKKKSESTGTEFCYFPNCRTLKDLRSKPLVFDKGYNQIDGKKALDSVELAHFFYQGDIDFGASDPHSKPCKTYIIRGLHGQSEALLEVRNCPDTVYAKRLMVVN